MHFQKETRILASAARVFAFHERPDALALLIPPWQPTRIVQAPTSLARGTRVILQTRLGPIWTTIEAEHVEYEPGHLFADRMLSGPFRAWYHRHVVEPDGALACRLVDDVRYELPGGTLGAWLGGAFARRQLQRMFDYRHDITRRECEG